MAEDLLDLWPSDLGIGSLPRSPVSILRQQARALSAKLDNQILARVDSRPATSFTYDVAFSSSAIRSRFIPSISHRLLLIVPSVEDYTLDLLNLVQGEELYPIFAQIKAKDQVPLKDEEALVNWLRQAFASQTTRSILGSLLSLAQ